MFTVIIANFIIGVVGVLGVGILLKTKLFDEEKLHYLISLAAGVMLSVAILDLLPHSIEEGGEGIFPYFLGGIIIFFLLEKFLFWHHHHGGHGHKPTAKLILIGDGLHNFLDGVIIASAFYLNFQTGLIATFGVILHEIPQEVGDFGVLIASGLSKKTALVANFMSALTSVAGGVVGWYALEAMEGFHGIVSSVAAGMFLYIACADLIPELHHEKLPLKKNLLQLSVFFLGIILVAIIGLFETH